MNTVEKLSFVKMLSALTAFGISNIHGGEFKVRSLWESNVTMLRLARIPRKEFLRTTADGTIFIVYDRDRRTAREILLSSFKEDDILKGACATPTCRLRVVVSKGASAEPPDHKLRYPVAGRGS